MDPLLLGHSNGRCVASVEELAGHDIYKNMTLHTNGLVTANRFAQNLKEILLDLRSEHTRTSFLNRSRFLDFEITLMINIDHGVVGARNSE